MDYSEKEIKQADCAIGMMEEQDKLMSGHDVRSAMRKYGDPYNMVTVLKDDLKLIASKGDSWVLTDEGRKAARMGFANYLRYRKVLEKVSFWGPLVSIVAALFSIIGAVLSWVR